MTKANYEAVPPFQHGQRWGIWELDLNVLVLRDRHGYEVDLERCNTSARMLDWIMQIAAKPATYSNEDVGDLARALSNLLEPQATLCSFGNDTKRPLNVKAFMKDRSN